MDLAELDFAFPEELIAQHPREPRDACRLLVLARDSGAIAHRIFRDLPELLVPGDVLVLNDSRVLPARLRAVKETGGRVELLFLRAVDAPLSNGGRVWEALARPSHRLRAGLRLRLPGGESVSLERSLGAGRWLVAGPEGSSLLDVMDRWGEMPLPPYIKASLRDRSEYQTVFAAEPGSAAAPTAGLHFTQDLLTRLRVAGVQTATVTLHVGLDTFRPISTGRVEDHPIHTEAYRVDHATLAALNSARATGRRLVAVGTTTVRVLETLYAEAREGAPATGPAAGFTDIFITPGYRFRAVDALITNFHLPRTSLLALVMAFAGVELTRHAYAEAVAQRYRFFSFGDAMLIHGDLAGQAGVGRS
ncbi:MAG: tRNA preQ1(34) S-adenosylmethionine ribosyltransferase-isomerase QueA [Thermoleophilia bacterium]